MAQLAVAAAGQFIGNAILPGIGGQIGWALGSALGASLFGDKVESAKLGDTSAVRVEYGSPIPRGYAAMRTTGAQAWASDKRGVTTESGGKGGPAVETTVYYQDFLVILNERPGGAVTRVWANGKLVYNVLPSATDLTLAASVGTEYWADLRVYDGNAAQLPDPVYEAAVGAGNAPAYRGRTTVFIESLNCGPSGQPPVLEFEVVENAVTGPPRCVELQPGVEHLLADAGGWVIDPFKTATTFANTGAYTSGVFNHGGGTVRTTTPVAGGCRYAEFRIDDSSSAPDWVWRMGIRDDADTFFYLQADLVSGVYPRTISFAYNADTGLAWIRTATGGDWLGVSAGNPSTCTNGSPTGLTGTGLRLEFYVNTPSYPDVQIEVRTTAESQTDAMPAGFVPWASDAVSGALITPGTVGLDEVVQDLCGVCGLSAGEVDVTALAGTNVDGFALTQPGAVRSALEVLAAAYYFDAVESGGVLRFVPRGGAVAATLPFGDLGAARDQAEQGNPLGLNRDDPATLPSRLSLAYSSATADYQNGTAYSDLLADTSAEARVVSLPLVLTPERAQGVAEAMLLDQHAAATAGQCAITNEQPRLEPTDVLTLTDEDGSTFRVRMVRETLDSGVRAFEWVLDDPTALVAAGVSADPRTPTITVSRPGATQMLVLDIPILRDADDGLSVYVPAKKLSGSWPGAQVFDSDDDAAFTARGTVSNQAVFGKTTVALTDWTGGNVFDEGGSVTVDIGAGAAASYTREQLLNENAGAWLIGDEVIQARSATLLSTAPNVFRLRGLLRGRRGTEWAMTGHVAGERAVLLRSAGMLRVDQDSGALGVLRYWRAVTLGRTLASQPSVQATIEGRSMKPFAPVALRANRDVAGAITMTWARRSRYAYRFLSAAPLPNSEATETYECDLLDGSGNLVSTQTVDAPALTLSAAQRVATLAEGLGRLVTHGGNFYGVDTEGLGSRRILQIDALGNLTGQSVVLGDDVPAMLLQGGNLYTIGHAFTAGTPAAYLSTTAYRIDPANVALVAASSTAATAGDYQALAFDGTALWAAGYYSGHMVKLNASTMAVSASIDIAEPGIWAVASNGSGTMYVSALLTGEVFAWQESGPTELWRVAPGASQTLHYRDGKLYVATDTAVVVLNASTGATLHTHAGRAVGVPGAGLFVDFGSEVAYKRDGTPYVEFLSASSGAFSRRVVFSGISALAGASGATLYAIGSPTSSFTNYQTWGYTLIASFSGYSFKVHQMSNVVGRGYPATFNL